MSLKLQLTNQYPPVNKQIDFPESLPQITLITGFNGCGKTRLLNAIKEGDVQAEIDGEVVQPSNIQYYNNRTLEPKTEQQVKIDYSSERDLIWDILQHVVQETYSNIWKNDKTLPSDKDSLIDHISSLVDEDIQKLKTTLYEHNRKIIISVTSIFNKGKETRNNANRVVSVAKPTDEQTNLVNKLKLVNTSIKEILDSIVTETGLTVFEWDKELFISEYPSDIKSKPFERSFSRWISNYVEHDIRNEALRKDRDDQGLEASPLDDKVFEEKYGKKPWFLVDAVLKSAKINYQIKRPSYRSDAEYQARLVNLHDRSEVQLKDLSSGEKTILSLFSALNYVSETDDLRTLPKLLLLDEVDSSLHPSLTKHLLVSLNEMCKEKNIYIVLTTHSPTTVALTTNEESIHILKKSQEGGSLNRSSVDQALSLLTDGIPMLSVKQELRRPVFVESTYDASYYEAFYKIYINNSERGPDCVSLSFISAGGPHNGGCETVIQQVSALKKAGNQSIFGIIDWDNKYKSTDRIIVPGNGECRRYTIENYVFDPIAVCIYLLREKIVTCEQINLDPNVRYYEIPKLDEGIIEKMVIKLVTDVLGKPDTFVKCKYHGGTEYKLPVKLLHYKGHDYLTLLKKKYDIKNHQFEMKIINDIYSNHPEIVPKEIFDLFSTLENIATV